MSSRYRVVSLKALITSVCVSGEMSFIAIHEQICDKGCTVRTHKDTNTLSINGSFTPYTNICNTKIYASQTSWQSSESVIA